MTLLLNKNKFLNLKGIQTLIIAMVFFIGFCSLTFALDCGDDANPALKSMCDIIMFLQGRIGRSLAVFMVLGEAWNFAQGELKWKGALTFCIGVGMFFAPVSFAVWLLPEYIQGISGGGYDVSVKYTPAEIIQCACPNLR